MTQQAVKAQVISRPGNWGNMEYEALEVDIEGLECPYVLTMSFPTVGYQALAKQADPHEVLKKLAEAINAAGIQVNIESGGKPAR
jgi:hypothetical protein